MADPAARTTAPPDRATRAGRGQVRASLSRRLRVWRFAVVGAGVMVAGAALLVCLVELLGVNPHLAYFMQAVFSIEASFLLSRWWTWADRRGAAGGALAGEWLRFHSSRLLTVPANQALFSVLVGVGVGYLAATAIGIAAGSVVNFLVAHTLVFRAKEAVT